MPIEREESSLLLQTNARFAAPNLTHWARYDRRQSSLTDHNEGGARRRSSMATRDAPHTAQRAASFRHLHSGAVHDPSTKKR